MGRAVGVWLLVGLTALLLSGLAYGWLWPPGPGLLSPALTAPGQPAGQDEPTTCSEPAPEGVSILKALVERLQATHEAMQGLRSAPDLETARSAARTVLDLITGPQGRHAGPGALAPGVLPGDGPTITEPGLVLQSLDALKEPRTRQFLVSVILGDIDRWRAPSQRWDEIDAAVAAWRPDYNPMPGLDGHMMRVVGWSLLALESPTAARAREYASHGLLHTAASLGAARDALADACVEGLASP